MLNLNKDTNGKMVIHSYPTGERKYGGILQVAQEVEQYPMLGPCLSPMVQSGDRGSQEVAPQKLGWYMARKTRGRAEGVGL